MIRKIRPARRKSMRPAQVSQSERVLQFQHTIGAPGQGPVTQVTGQIQVKPGPPPAAPEAPGKAPEKAGGGGKGGGGEGDAELKKALEKLHEAMRESGKIYVDQGFKNSDRTDDVLMHLTDYYFSN